MLVLETGIARGWGEYLAVVPDDAGLLFDGSALKHLQHHGDGVFHCGARLHRGLRERSTVFRRIRGAGGLAGRAQKQEAEHLETSGQHFCLRVCVCVCTDEEARAKLGELMETEMLLSFRRKGLGSRVTSGNRQWPTGAHCLRE